MRLRLMDQGPPLVPVEFVQRQLGHSSYQTTLSIYRHWIPDRDDVHADAIEAALKTSGQ